MAGDARLDPMPEYRASARAALMAMRISDADMDDDDYVDMLIAGRAVLPEHDEPLQEDAQACFNAMIDAILAEGE